ncbi:MAG: hypothetical protein KF760_07570 [Candidatus Eremiobacteraeota bacterium]|nr:hypothetical protein [Candidatus Eremiobacteraeota bacterium]MCW5871532.1 hypothetical protein [Candidatus Eremiobacteraeota bacterium]
MSRKRQAFSLAEALLCTGMLGLLLVTLFVVLNFGFQAFGVGTTRMGILGEIESLVARLRRDIESSTFSSIKIQNDNSRRVTVSTSAGPRDEVRHILCMVGMSEWGQPQAFQPQDGAPEWNRYWLYHSDLGVPKGSLYRLEIEPANVGSNRGSGWKNWTDYLTDYALTPPATGPLYTSQVLRTRRLTSQLLGLEVTRTTAAVTVRLRLLWDGRKSPEAGKRTEVQEIYLRVPPRNRML